MDNNEIKDVNEVKENKIDEVNKDNAVDTKKNEQNLDEPKGNSYAFLIFVFILLIAAVIVMPMILNK